VNKTILNLIKKIKLVPNKKKTKKECLFCPNGYDKKIKGNHYCENEDKIYCKNHMKVA
jgi:hypothetical protein